MQVPAELMQEACDYLRITAVALPFQAIMLTFSAFLRAGAHMKVIMLITGFINVCNIIGNAVLINGLGPLPRLGAAGAALSSSIFRVVGMLLMGWMFSVLRRKLASAFQCFARFPNSCCADCYTRSRVPAERVCLIIFRRQAV